MKKILLLNLLLFFFSYVTDAQNTNKTNEKLLAKTTIPPFDYYDLLEYFEQSDAFDKGTSFLWLDYQFVSNRLKRENYKSTTIPPLGIYYEKRLFHNLGARASFSLNWWKEDVLLVKSAAIEFKEEFKFRYTTFSLGLSWHIAISDRIDPYVGLSYSFRKIYAECDCTSDSRTSKSIDFFLGARFMLSEKIFINGEIGHTGTGYFKIGGGYKFGDF